MSVFEIAVTAVALATDAFAITVANCAANETNLTRRKAWAMPAAFAVFQFFMPVVGFYLGGLVAEFLRTFAKFLTAGVFFILAVKIVLDIFEEKRDEKKGVKERRTQNLTLRVLLIQAFATSIDAFAVGVTFAASALPFSVFLAAGIIGVITFLIVSVALFIGRSMGKLLGEYAVWLGAAILFALAVKNLIEGVI